MAALVLRTRRAVEVTVPMIPFRFEQFVKVVAVGG